MKASFVPVTKGCSFHFSKGVPDQFNSYGVQAYMTLNDAKKKSLDEGFSTHLVTNMVINKGHKITFACSEGGVPITCCGKPDLLVVTSNGYLLVVSITRAFKGGNKVYDLTEALRLLTKKLEGLHRVMTTSILKYVDGLKTKGLKKVPVLHVLVPNAYNLALSLQAHKVLMDQNPDWQYLRVLFTVVGDKRLYR